MQFAVDLFFELRQHGVHPRDPLLQKLRESSLREEVETLSALAQWLNSPVARAPYVAQARGLYYLLLIRLSEAFTRDGPSRWPANAMVHAMAHILNLLGVKSGRGRCLRAAGIRKDLQRYPNLGTLLPPNP